MSITADKFYIRSQSILKFLLYFNRNMVRTKKNITGGHKLKLVTQQIKLKDTLVQNKILIRNNLFNNQYIYMLQLI